MELVFVTHISLAQLLFLKYVFFQNEKLNAVGWRPIFLLEYPKKEAKMLLPEGLNSSLGERECINNIKIMYTLIVEGNSTFTVHYNISIQPQFWKMWDTKIKWHQIAKCTKKYYERCRFTLHHSYISHFDLIVYCILFVLLVFFQERWCPLTQPVICHWVKERKPFTI